MKESLEYNLPKNAYANFDALSLKDFIIQRLNENAKFTDQNYEGSNLAAFIDIIAYSYHVLLFYLNQTASESIFSQATLYENINKIVNLIGYKPTGKQTSLVPVSCKANASLSIGNYTLRKYSYVLIDKIQYTILDDFTFEKTLSGEEDIESIKNNLIMYQGTIGEYPSYIASGVEFETLPIVVENRIDTNDTRFIANGTVSVYVKEQSDGKWYQYKEIDNIFLAKDSDRYYSVRLNDSGFYEVKFGNGVFGRKLTTDDEVAIYYILSDNARGSISKGTINGNKLFNYNTSRFNQIYNDTSTIEPTSIINLSNNTFLYFTNTDNSTAISNAESVEQIRQNVPKYLNSQLKLVTEQDYDDAFLNKEFSNIITSVKTVSNKTYVNEYIDYFYKICVDPNKSNRVIINQVNFADSCDFNNVNVFCVPKFDMTIDGAYPPFLSNSLKNLIVEKSSDKKLISHEVIPRDPVYMAFDIGFTGGIPTKNIANTSYLQVVRTNNFRINPESLKKKIGDLILKFFSSSNNKLGQKLDIAQLTADILNIEGVSVIRTVNKNQIFNGVSFITWNPVYENSDESLINQTTTLEFFKFPYFYNPQSIYKKIKISDE
jgi:hypothetical protein